MQSVYLQAYNQYDDRARDETLSALFEVLVSRQAELEQLEGKIGLPVPGRQEQLQQELNAFAQKCGVQPGQILELSPVILAKIETVQGEIFWPEQDSVVYLGVSGTCTPLTASIRGGEYHKVAPVWTTVPAALQPYPVAHMRACRSNTHKACWITTVPLF
jgi:hypothetical protein